MTLLAQSRPLRATEILDASFQVYRAHFVVLATICALATVPPAVLTALTPAPWSNVIDLLGNFLLPIAHGAVAIFITALMNGGPIGAVEAYRGIRGRRLSLIGIQLMTGFVIGLGLLLLIIPGIIAIAITAVAPAVCVIENLSAQRSLERSQMLSKGHRKHVLATWMLSYGILILLVLGGGVMVGFLGATAGAGDAASNAMIALVFTLVYPFVFVANCLLYFDLRVRREGADLEALVKASEASLPTAPETRPVINPI